MNYECRNCKHKCSTAAAYLRCPQCGHDLEDSIRIADMRVAEERRDLAADAERRRVA